MPQSTCGWQRTTLWSWFSLSTIGGFCVLPFVSQVREMEKWHEPTDGEDRGSAVNHPECDSQGFWRCVGL